MTATFREIGNYQPDQTCSLCGAKGETLDVTTAASDLLHGVPLCGQCLTNLARVAAQHSAPPSPRNAGKGRGKAAPRTAPVVITHEECGVRGITPLAGPADPPFALPVTDGPNERDPGSAG